MDTALQTLLLAAGLAAPSLPPAPAARARAVSPSPVVEIARLPVSSIAAAQARGALTRRLGDVELALSAAFDFNGDSWLKVSAGGQTAAAPFSSLAGGADLAVGSVPVAAAAQGDAVTVAARGSSTTVSYMDLVRSLFRAARHVRPHQVLDYAVVVEDGAPGAVPASVCLIRRDADGTFYVTYRTPQQLSRPQWFAAVNGVLKGFVLDGADLVFIEKPVPPLPRVAADSADGAAPQPVLVPSRPLLAP